MKVRVARLDTAPTNELRVMIVSNQIVIKNGD
jgi:hypothetical protein